MSVQQQRLVLDTNVRRSSNGTALIGGAPVRVVRLSAAGARLLDAWLTGEPVEPSQEADELRRRLLGAGIVHPVLTPSDAPAGVTTAFGVVVPVHDDAAGLNELLRVVRAEFDGVPIVVVDDASPDPAPVAAVAARFDSILVRHGVNRGPAAARNTGWRRLVAERPHGSEPSTATPEIVVFLDADVVPAAGALGTMLAHFGNPAVAAVAPRVRARPGPSTLDGYETLESPLDLGPGAALVRPGTRISYVPSAALAVTVGALTSSAGFDESMRLGEDVDFIWRLVADRKIVRYEPAAVMYHRNRPSLATFIRQRHGYGSAAATLAARHGDSVAPVRLPAAMLATCGVLALGRTRSRAVATAVAAVRSRSLAAKLDGKVDHPQSEAAQLTMLGHLHAMRWLADAATRAWLPLLMLTGRLRRVLAAALIIPPLLRWLRVRPPVDPVRFVVLKATDDAAYCSGVWVGAIRNRSITAIRPSVKGL